MSDGNVKRRDKSFNEAKHRQRFSEPTTCKICHASYVKGRWSWKESPPEAEKVVCPACEKIEGDVACGEINIQGSFTDIMRRDVTNLIKNVEGCEIDEHPLERVISVDDNGDEILVKTTGRHLAQRIARALFKAYKGHLSYSYDRTHEKVEIRWDV